MRTRWIRTDVRDCCDDYVKIRVTSILIDVRVLIKDNRVRMIQSENSTESAFRVQSISWLDDANTGIRMARKGGAVLIRARNGVDHRAI